MQQPPPLVDVMMSRRPVAARGFARADSTLLVRREEPTPPRPTPRSFAAVRPSATRRWAGLIVLAALAMVTALSGPIDANATVRHQRLAANAQDLLRVLR